MTTPLDVYRQAWTDYWAHHLGPSYDQPPGNSYECDEFIARRVFAAGKAAAHPHHHEPAVASTPSHAPGREALGRTVYEMVLRGCSSVPWESVGTFTHKECCDTGERLYELGRASRDEKVAELRSSVVGLERELRLCRDILAGAEANERDLVAKYDARGRALAELESKLESYRDEIANLCVDKASLEGRLASANRRIAELEQQQKPAPAEDRRCGTCAWEKTGAFVKCFNWSNWQKR